VKWSAALVALVPPTDVAVTSTVDGLVPWGGMVTSIRLSLNVTNPDGHGRPNRPSAGACVDGAGLLVVIKVTGSEGDSTVVKVGAVTAVLAAPVARWWTGTRVTTGTRTDGRVLAFWTAGFDCAEPA
jgi:hypothetical protein